MEALSNKNNKKWIYYLGLFAVIIIWGVDPVVMQELYKYASPSSITVVGSLLAALFFTALSAKRLKSFDKSYLKTAIPISLITSTACLLQKIGLKFTTPSAYAFLEYLSCLIVPIALFVLIKKRPTFLQLFSGLMCVMGGFVFCGVADGGFAMGLGEIMCAMAGILLGVSIGAMGVYTKGLDIRLYMMTHMWVYCIYSLLVAFVLNFVSIGGERLEPFYFNVDFTVFVLIALSGFVIVAIGWFLRTEAIVHIDPTAVAVMSPISAVVTTALSVTLGLEEITRSLIVGAVIIIFAAILSSLSEEDVAESEKWRV